MAGYLSVVVAALSVGMFSAGLSRQSPPSTAPLPADLVYETFCKKEEPVRKKLFRAATREQKSVMTRAQIERWREANLSRISKAQLTALEELWTMASSAMFEPTDAGRQALEAFERRAGAAFSGRQMDELGPYGPCIAKGEIAIGARPGRPIRWTAEPTTGFRPRPA